MEDYSDDVDDFDDEFDGGGPFVIRWGEVSREDFEKNPRWAEEYMTHCADLRNHKNFVADLLLDRAEGLLQIARALRRTGPEATVRWSDLQLGAQLRSVLERATVLGHERLKDELARLHNELGILCGPTDEERRKLNAVYGSGEYEALQKEWMDLQAELFDLSMPADRRLAIQVQLDDIATRRDAARARESDALRQLTAEPA